MLEVVYGQLQMVPLAMFNHVGVDASFLEFFTWGELCLLRFDNALETWVLGRLGDWAMRKSTALFSATWDYLWACFETGFGRERRRVARALPASISLAEGHES